MLRYSSMSPSWSLLQNKHSLLALLALLCACGVAAKQRHMRSTAQAGASAAYYDTTPVGKWLYPAPNVGAYTCPAGYQYAWGLTTSHLAFPGPDSIVTAAECDAGCVAQCATVHVECIPASHYLPDATAVGEAIPYPCCCQCTCPKVTSIGAWSPTSGKAVYRDTSCAKGSHGWSILNAPALQATMGQLPAPEGAPTNAKMPDGPTCQSGCDALCTSRGGDDCIGASTYGLQIVGKLVPANKCCCTCSSATGAAGCD